MTLSFSTSALALVGFLLSGSPSHATEFTDYAAGFSTTTVLAGAHQATTNNPDGTAINFWSSAFENQPAVNATLSNPHMAQADAYGNIYIADKSSHAILKITTDGLIHTYAGTHLAGFNGDGPAQATTLQLNNPNGLFVFPDGTLYLLDPGNHRIRRVGVDGVMTTIVNDPEPDWYPSGRALWVRADEQLIYYADEFTPLVIPGPANGAVIKQWTPSGGIVTLCDKATGFVNSGNIAVNPVDGKLYVADRAEDDTTNTLSGLWRIDGTNTRVRVLGNNAANPITDGLAANNCYMKQVRGVAFLPNGAYFVCGHKDGSIWYVDTAGIVHRYIYGKGTSDSFSPSTGLHPPITASFYMCQPRAVTVSPDGNLIGVSNDSGFVFKVTSTVVQPLPVDLKPTQLSSNALHLIWSGLLGHSYVVERTLELQPTNWQIIGATGSAGGVTEFIDAAATQQHAYYRLSTPR